MIEVKSPRRTSEDPIVYQHDTLIDPAEVAAIERIEDVEPGYEGRCSYVMKIRGIQGWRSIDEDSYERLKEALGG